MGRIHKLPDELANQIAAGEVVERPASVVKELLENALDAGATRVTVDVESGGTALVRVVDDGDGMTPADAALALERHATSKIHALADLFRLGTFGFRGEALPSIGSVSKLTLRTRPKDASEAHEIVVEGGRTVATRPAGGATGTTIEVRELFFNVPARRKFLKATATESAHVGEVVLGAALARPDVTFTLSRDGRIVREYLRAPSRAERARAASSGENLAHVTAERGPIRIEAMLAAPERARSGATGLALLVNGRPVRDRQLARAVAHAYGSVLDSGRYPVGVVWIDLPPELVDVNVHPQKAEVRFTDARGVFDAVTRELHAVLAHTFQLPDAGGSPYAHLGARAREARFELPTLQALGQIAQRVLDDQSAAGATVAPPTTLPRPEPIPIPVPAENLFLAERTSTGAGAGLYATLRFVGQVHGTYLLCEGEDGLYILDQHAAAERVTFDRLRRAHASRALPTQRLLVAEIVELPPADVAALEENADEVLRLGVELRAVGDGAVAVHALPALLKKPDPARVVRDLASELGKSGGRAFGDALDLVLATMACHGSIRAGDAIAPEEVKALLFALDAVDFGGHCPHGRPVVMRLPWNELERRVGR
ncbi:MAG: DNA mismatch repair endonuclease MutL [Labilithrix sp.]|nr:DNA mismatch repair endonuclease MutL [Labilithrix sp.]MCW5815502.1 DNA mismatch repair endonuclease MutL [Labilithrix sp.]